MPAVECGAIAKRMETDGAAVHAGGLLDGKTKAFPVQVKKIEESTKVSREGLQ